MNQTKALILLLLESPKGEPRAWAAHLVAREVNKKPGAIKIESILNELKNKFNKKIINITNKYVKVLDLHPEYRYMVKDSKRKSTKGPLVKLKHNIDTLRLIYRGDKRHLFSLSLKDKVHLKAGTVSKGLIKVFSANKQSLSPKSKISQQNEKKWTITNRKNTQHGIEETTTGLEVYREGEGYINFDELRQSFYYYRKGPEPNSLIYKECVKPPETSGRGISLSDLEQMFIAQLGPDNRPRFIEAFKDCIFKRIRGIAEELAREDYSLRIEPIKKEYPDAPALSLEEDLEFFIKPIEKYKDEIWEAITSSPSCLEYILSGDLKNKFDTGLYKAYPPERDMDIIWPLINMWEVDYSNRKTRVLPIKLEYNDS